MEDIVCRVPGPSLHVAADGFPERWDSLCCDHLFSRQEADDDLVGILGSVEIPFTIKVEPIHDTTEPDRHQANAPPSVQTPRLSGVRQGDTGAVAASTTTNDNGGMSLRSGQVKSTIATSTLHVDDPASGSDVEEASCKRRRRSNLAHDEYEYSQLSDPEERKLEKRRAKNRRTARVSRERKQAEVAQMREQLATQAAELERLKGLIKAKDEQIVQMRGVSSSDMSAPQAGVQSTRQRASESANEEDRSVEDCTRLLFDDLYTSFAK